MLKSVMLTTSLLCCAASGAHAACEFTVESSDAMQYNASELTADADCDTITVTLVHTGKLPAQAMGHN